MITSLDDLIVSLSSDAAMIAAIAGLYGLLRRGLRTMVREEITTAVHDAITAELGDGDHTPRELVDGLRAGQQVTGQACADLRGDIEGMSRRVDTLRTMLFSHIDSGHPRGRT